MSPYREPAPVPAPETPIRPLIWMWNPFRIGEIVDLTRSVGLNSYQTLMRGWPTYPQSLTVVTDRGYERAESVPHRDGTIEIRPCQH